MAQQLVPAFPSPALATFRGAGTGRGAHPGEEGDAAGIGGADRPAPGPLVGVSSATDVATALAFAREQGLGVGVPVAGHPGDHRHAERLYIDTARMRAITVDAEARVVRVEAGATWGEALLAAQGHGLAPFYGAVPGIGVVGYTLYGGIGWRARRFGAASSSVRAAEIVTADGRVRRIDADHEPDLLWAIGSGSGTVGIVTALELALYPLPTNHSGALFFPLARAAGVLDRYAAWVTHLPEGATASLIFMHLPPLPDVPESLRGQASAVVVACSVPPGVDGEAPLAPFRALGDPLIDTARAMPQATIGALANDPTPPLPAFRSTMRVTALSAEVRAALLRVVGPAAASPLLLTEIRHPAGPTIRERREAPFLVQTVGLLPDAARSDAVREHTATVGAALAPHVADAISFGWRGDGDYGTARTRAGSGAATDARLAALKARYDPTNLFRPERG